MNMNKADIFRDPVTKILLLMLAAGVWFNELRPYLSRPNSAPIISKDKKELIENDPLWYIGSQIQRVNWHLDRISTQVDTMSFNSANWIALAKMESQLVAIQNELSITAENLKGFSSEMSQRASKGR